MRDLAIALPDRPGALAGMGEALGRAGVSIEGGGVFVASGTGVAPGANILVQYSDHDHRLVLVVDDLPRGQAVSRAWEMIGG